MSGAGTVSSASGVLAANPYSFRTRFGDTPGTNPEELLAAAHAGCFSMALSAQLAQAGLTAASIRTTCAISLEKQAEGMSALLQAAAIYVREHEPIVALAGGKKAAAPTSPAEISQQVVEIEPIWRSPTQLDVEVKIQDGMHISAHDTVAGMMASQLAISGEAAESVNSIEDPPAEPLKVSFSELSIHGYHQTIIIKVAFKQPPRVGSTLQLSLRYQACDENACLPVASKQVESQVP